MHVICSYSLNPRPLHVYQHYVNNYAHTRLSKQRTAAMAVEQPRMDSTRKPDSNSSRKSKHRAEKNRLLTELFQLYPDLQIPESSSSYSKRTADSHPHRRSESHPRSQPSRRSNDSISSVLLMTTERLHSETARANAAERQIADVMTLFRNTHDQKIKLERELLRVREELSLYKVQLEVAQKEIFRAQEIVDRIDRQRVEAEESAVRNRERSRKLTEARAVDLAMEEGRRLGFEEGLNQGRMIGQAESEHHTHRSRKESSGSSETIPSHKSRSTARSKRRPTPEELPVATPRSASSRPEDITIQEATAPPRPISAPKQSPPRRSIILPPDNYIPILNADATISLPPPHELAMPLPTEAVRSSAKGKSIQNTSYVRSSTPPSPTPRREPPDPEQLIATSASHELRSPATYPNRPPLRRREIVMPIPMGPQLIGSHTAIPSNSSRQGFAQSPSIPKNTPLPAIRTASNTTIPAIEVETPSTKSPSSEKTAYDPVLLTPDQASKAVPLPSQDEHMAGAAVPFDPNGKDTITGVLPDNNLPPGFVPLSPITGMANLNPYPPGFAPSLQGAGKPAAPRPDFVYPASPLARSQ